jgi:hypothetical protein
MVVDCVQQFLCTLCALLPLRMRGVRFFALEIGHDYSCYFGTDANYF